MESGKNFKAIVIKKTFSQIEEDINSILSLEKPVSASEVKKLWTSFLELTVEPVGWRAVWKISRDICLQFGIEFPTVAVVMVDNVNYDELTANVIICCLDENASEILPDHIKDIPLVQLYPTIAQENNHLDVAKTADSLESLRLFYRHLWYPWDEDDDSANWVADHLENRIKLHFDLTSRTVPRDASLKINKLIQTGNDIYNRIQQSLALHENDEHENNDVVLGQLYVELCNVKENLNLLEMKHMRDRFDSSLKFNGNSSPTGTENQQILLAWLDGISDNLLNLLQKIKGESTETKSFSCSPSLQTLLHELLPKNTIYVGEGVHYLKSHCELSSEGAIKGAGAPTNTIIQDAEGGLSLLDVFGKETYFSNLTFFGTKVKFLVAVRFGRCEMSNVVVKGSYKNDGIFIHSGAEFYADNCTFTDCCIALEAVEGSKIVLKNCTFKSNLHGLVFQSCYVELDNCKFIDNDKSAILQKSGSDQNNGVSETTLTSLQNVTAKGSTFSGNKVDVLKECTS